MTATGDPGRLFLPGPGAVAPDILAALVTPQPPLDTAATAALLTQIDAPLRQLFRTADPVFHLGLSHTGLMEAAIRTAVEQRVLVVEAGPLGRRFGAVAQRCGREVIRIVLPPGRSLEPDHLARFLDGPPVNAVALAHGEPGTGVLAPLAELAEVVRGSPGTLLLVDATATLGGVPLETDLWGLDAVFAAADHALALPSGLGLATVSPRLLEVAARVEQPGWYLDLARHRAAAADLRTVDPPSPMLPALVRQMERIQEEGLEGRWSRHYDMLLAVERWVAAGGRLRFVAPEGRRLWTASVLDTPASHPPESLVRALAARGWRIAPGAADLAERSIGLGHMGEATPDTLGPLLVALDQVLDPAA